MEYIFGIITTLAIIIIARTMKIEHLDNFYPMVLIVIALIYVFFAVFDQTTKTIVVESIVASLFILTAFIGLKRSTIIVATGLVAHGVYDLGHNLVIENAGVPHWWPIYCGVIDVILGAWVFLSIRRTL